jgi:hypothetical protein
MFLWQEFTTQFHQFSKLLQSTEVSGRSRKSFGEKDSRSGKNSQTETFV